MSVRKNMWNLTILDLLWKILFAVCRMDQLYCHYYLLFISVTIAMSQIFLKFVLFADGTNIFTSNKDSANLHNEEKRELNKIYTGFCVNNFSVIIEKII